MSEIADGSLKGCTVKDLIDSLQQLDNKDAVVYCDEYLLYPELMEKKSFLPSEVKKKSFVPIKREYYESQESSEVKYNAVKFSKPNSEMYKFVSFGLNIQLPEIFKRCKESLWVLEGESQNDVLQHISKKLYFFNRPIYFFPDTKDIIDSKDFYNTTLAVDKLFEPYDKDPVILISKVPQQAFIAFMKDPISYFQETLLKS